MTNHEERYNIAMNKAIKEICELNPGLVKAYINDPRDAPPYRIISKVDPRNLVLPDECLLYYGSIALKEFPEKRYCSPIFVDEDIRPYETL